MEVKATSGIFVSSFKIEVISTTTSEEIGYNNLGARDCIKGTDFPPDVTQNNLLLLALLFIHV